MNKSYKKPKKGGYYEVIQENQKQEYDYLLIKNSPALHCIRAFLVKTIRF